MAKDLSPPPLEHISPLASFFKQDAVAAGLLLSSALIALGIANSPFGEQYHDFLHTHFSITFGNWAFDKSLHHWINDGLMAIFFFLVGLEIKREVLVGELASVRKMLLPAVAAMGGMIVPALIYTSFNFGTDTLHGWGIPMATDIAFAMGCMALLGRAVPPALGVFLVAVAIVDDLGAVLVIAIFYSERIDVVALWTGCGLLAVSYGLNRLGVRSAIPYALLFHLVWLAFVSSGVHATIAGVLLAFTIPAAARYQTSHFFGRMSVLLYRFSDAEDYKDRLMVSARQQQIVRSILTECHHVEAPLQRIEHSLHPLSVFVIMPIFAFANAGVTIDLAGIGSLLLERVTLGVFFGLVLGKFLGVFVFTWFSVKLKLTELPNEANWGHIAGVGLIAGIGFTMALFINELAFKGHPDAARYLTEAKIAIFLASATAGIAGSLVLRWASGGKTYGAGSKAH